MSRYLDPKMFVLTSDNEVVYLPGPIRQHPNDKSVKNRFSPRIYLEKTTDEKFKLVIDYDHDDRQKLEVDVFSDEETALQKFRKIAWAYANAYNLVCVNLVGTEAVMDLPTKFVERSMAKEPN